MKINLLPDDEREDWNNFAAKEPSFALIQSWEWGEFKEKLGWKAFRLAVKEQNRIIAGAQLLIKPLPLNFASIAYIPRGPIGNWLDKQIVTQLLSELHRISHLHKAIFLHIEPTSLFDPGMDQTFQGIRFRPSSYTNQPRATIILNLESDLTDILKQMRKRTREYIMYSSRHGVTIRRGERKDVLALYELMQATGKRSHFPPRSLEYYEQEWHTFAESKQSVLFLAYFQDQLLAAHMASCFGEHAAYIHGGSINGFEHLRPNYLLVWEAIKWAKEMGCQTYDLWGIPEEIGQVISEGKELPVSDRTDGLWGVYRFKSGFSKNIVYYTGAHDYIYNPLLYRLITNRLINIETLDRLSVMFDSF